MGGVFPQEFAYVNKEFRPVGKKALEAKISLDFKEIDIGDALKFLSKKAGLNIIPTKKVSGRITLNVENATLKDVFDIMLRSNGLAYDKKGDIYNVMTEDEYRALYGKDFSDVRKVKVFHLRYAIPEQVFTLCDTLKSDIGKVILDSESGSLLIMDTPEKLKEIKEVIDSLERKTTILKVFDLKYANAKDIAEQLKNQLDLKKVGSIRADERSNQVIVQTLPARIKDIEKLIAHLDRKTREVLMDVRIVKIKLSNTNTKGVEWEGIFDIARRYGLTYLGSYPFSSVNSSTATWRSRKEVYNDVGYMGSYPFSGTTSDLSSGTKGVGTEKVHIGIVGKHDFDILFKYFLSIGETKVVANPKIAVIENQEARIHIGEKQAYITNTTTQTTSTTTVAEEVTFVDVGVQIHITPTINEDNYITLKVKPEISSVVSYLVTAANNKIPILDTSTVETTVMVKDGATVLIGGLKEESQTNSSTETPLISKIPILGSIFSSSSKEDTRNEFLVLLTPHIIKGDELTTGYRRDFGYRLDKEDEKYPSLTKEEISLKYKSYRDYDLIKGDEKSPLKMKPMR
jgi:type II secretory pathway component GspD/PulD (secretin)